MTNQQRDEAEWGKDPALFDRPSVGHCIHGGGPVKVTVGGKTPNYEWAMAIEAMEPRKPVPTERIELCLVCADRLPSQRSLASRAAASQASGTAAAGGAEPVSNEHKHRAASPDTEPGFVCTSCDKLSTVDDADDNFPPQWECSREDCGAEFVSMERNCPDCNRPFSRKLAEHACEDCQQEVEEADLLTCADCDERYVRVAEETDGTN